MEEGQATICIVCMYIAWLLLYVNCIHIYIYVNLCTYIYIYILIYGWCVHICTCMHIYNYIDVQMGATCGGNYDKRMDYSRVIYLLTW